MAIPPLLAALRWRLGASASLLAVAVLAVFTAAAGPLFLGSADTDVLHSTLSDSSFTRTQINAGNVHGGQLIVSSVLEVPGLAHQVGLNQWYGPGVVSEQVGIRVPYTGVMSAESKIAYGELVSRSGVCAHLHFISGHCPTAQGQITMTNRDANLLGVKVGQSVRSAAGPLLLTGITQPANPRAPYWLGDNYFSFGIHASDVPPDLDSFFTPASTLSGQKIIATAQFPLQPLRPQPATVPALSRTVNSFLYAVRNHLNLGATTGLLAVIGSYQRESNEIVSIVAVVALQLLLLTLFVLYVLVVRTATERRAEVALARLRGATLPSVLAIGVGEPVVILVAALPIGLLLAWLGMEVASRVALSNAPVPLSLLVLVAGLAAFGSGLAAVAAGSRKLLTRRLVDEIRATEDRSSPIARAAWEGAAIALAGAGLLELGTAGVLNGSRPNPIALFAPGLIAVGVAVPGVRLLPLACRYAMRRTRYSKRVGLGLAVRQVMRRPAVLRQVLILTVAVALASFAIIGWSVAGTNRSLRADFDVGAAKVAQVTFPDSVNLLTAVRRADPTGRFAMAVMEESKLANLRLLAVDPTRLAKVAYWPADISSTDLAAIVRWLQPKVQPALVLTGSAVRMAVNLSAVVNPPPDLQFAMLDSSGNAQVADFGYLAPGTHTYTATLPNACLGGCYVTALTPIWYPGPGRSAHVQYTVSVSGLQVQRSSAWHEYSSRIYQTKYWNTNSSKATVAGTGTTLQLSVYNSANQDVTPDAIPGRLPADLRAVSTVTSQPTDPVHNSIQDFDGTSLNVNTTPDVVALPNLGSLGALISMPLAIRADQGTPVDTTYAVWLAADAPHSVLHRLAARGVKVVAVQTPAATLRQLNNGGLGLGYRFFVFAAAAAAALAVATTVLTFFLTARRRAFELAVLRALGVPTHTLRRSLITEQALVLIPGLVLGIVAALIASLVALAAVPIFSSNGGQPPLELTLPALPLVALAAALLLLLSAAAVTAALVTVGGVDLARLRLEVR
ncbi:MAG: FtsX-like permease family protein [Candidatus Dormibacteria bacterium]